MIKGIPGLNLHEPQFPAGTVPGGVGFGDWTYLSGIEKAPDSHDQRNIILRDSIATLTRHNPRLWDEESIHDSERNNALLMAAARTLGALQVKTPEVTGMLAREALMGPDDSSVRLMAAESLYRLDSATGQVVILGMTHDPDANTQGKALILMFRLEPDLAVARAVELLESRDIDPYVKNCALLELEAVRPALAGRLAALHIDSPELRATAVMLVAAGRQSKDEDAAVNPISRALSDQAAILTYALYGGTLAEKKAALRHLAEVAREDGLPTIAFAASSLAQEPELRVLALRELGRCDRALQSDIAVSLASDPDPEVQGALQEYGEQG